MFARISAVILLFFTLTLPLTAQAESFQSIRIGDADGFGFTSTAVLARPIQGVGPGPADSNGNGVLEPDEFLPDLNRDGGSGMRGKTISTTVLMRNVRAPAIFVRAARRSEVQTRGRNGPICPSHQPHRRSTGRI